MFVVVTWRYTFMYNFIIYVPVYCTYYTIGTYKSKKNIDVVGGFYVCVCVCIYIFYYSVIAFYFPTHGDGVPKYNILND